MLVHIFDDLPVWIACMRGKMSIRFDKTTALDLTGLAGLYRNGDLTPGALVAGLIERFEARGDDKVWIHRIPDADLTARAKTLEKLGPKGLPLYGIPFAIKDNMDVAGLPTTAVRPTAHPAIHSIPHIFPAGPARGRPWPWRRGWFPSRWAPTPPGRAASRPPSTISSG
jgi:hypothetical protein